MTGFPPKVRTLIMARADMWCERCGLNRGTEAHHRRARGLGGTRRESTNRASNGLWLDMLCHRWVESNRTEALEQGFLVPQTAEPAEVPVFYRGTRVLLDDLGNVGELV